MSGESGFFRGAGGSRFELPLPLPENFQHQVDRGQLVRVNEDGTDFADAPERARPKDAASKGEWVGWATYVDPTLTVDAADAQTKTDLIEKYG